MAPNLAVFALTVLSPRRWFASKRRARDGAQSPAKGSLAVTEHWQSPVPGTYRLTPGAGWFLIERDDDPSRPERPEKVLWSGALDRKLLVSDYEARSKKAKLPIIRPSASRNSSVVKLPPPSKDTESRRSSKISVTERPEVNFVRLDDGVTWLNDKDEHGVATKAPWQRFCIDKDSGEMRPMLVSDNPKRSRPSSTQSKSVSTGGTSTESITEARKSPRDSGVGRSASTKNASLKPSPAVSRAPSRLSQGATVSNTELQ